MKTIISFILALGVTLPAFATQEENMAVMTGTNVQVIAGQKIFQSAGDQGSPLVSWSQSGASTVIVQDTHFTEPALLVKRDGGPEDETDTATLHVIAGKETKHDDPIFQVTGCLLLSGDNCVIVYGDGSLSTGGGLLDNRVPAKGKLSLDPVNRQGIAEDGVTMRFSWAGGTLTVPTQTVTDSITFENGVTVSGFQSAFISDSTPAGRAVLTASNAATQRAAMGAQAATVHAELTGTDVSFATPGVYYKTISGNTTFTFSDVTNGNAVTVEITTTGDYQPTWPVEATWPGGSAPVQPDTSTVVYSFTVINGAIRGRAETY